jgi:hypothetical protein
MRSVFEAPLASFCLRLLQAVDRVMPLHQRIAAWSRTVS